MQLPANSILAAISTLKSQAVDTLFAHQGGGADFASLLGSQLQAFDGLGASPLAALASTPGAAQLPGAGSNLALFDPESAYRMMSLINYREVYYKAQYAELSQLQTQLKQMEQAGSTLGKLSAEAPADSLKSALQQFVSHYNDWIREVGPDVQAGGVLADTQAAQVSRYELEQSLLNPFYGVQAGLHGLAELGLAIDGRSGLATLDTAKLDAVLAGNRPGAVDALQQFGTSFAKSAGLLNAADNFVPRQLANLDRAIDYIADNQSALQAEFGTGAPARPSRQVAQALAAYNASHADQA